MPERVATAVRREVRLFVAFPTAARRAKNGDVSSSFLRRHLPVALAVSLAVAGITVGSFLWVFAPGGSTAVAAEEKRYDATGVIRSFGPERAYVSIAHDKIEGYMNAMTMPFEFKDRALGNGLSVGDKVRFSFVADREGKLLIVAITKQ
jgi:Cu(I)/Ag(I) efflux system protein CusF